MSSSMAPYYLYVTDITEGESKHKVGIHVIDFFMCGTVSYVLLTQILHF